MKGEEFKLCPLIPLEEEESVVRMAEVRYSEDKSFL
jgi:hypothetical protein